MWITRKIRKHPVWSAISALIFVFIPSIIQPWWGLFSNEPMVPAITKKLEGVDMPNITFAWLYWITIPVGFGMLGYIVYLARSNKSQQVVELPTSDQRLRVQKDRKFVPKKSYFLFIIIFAIGMGVGIGYPVVNKLYNILKTERESERETLVLTPKQVESKMRNWLKELGYIVDDHQVEDSHFYFLATSETGNKINIKFSKSDETLLKFQVEIIFKPNDQEAINKLGRKESNDLVVDIKKILGNLNLGFEVKTPLKIIIFNEGLFIEELTKPNLFKVLKRLDIARTNVSTSIYTALKVNP